MKYSAATSASLGSALLAGFSVADGERERIAVSEGGINFKVDWYDDGRRKPYRTIFWDSGRSVYKFDAAGRVKTIKVGSEKYRVYYKIIGNLKRVELKSSGRRNLAGEEDEQDAFDEGEEEEKVTPVHRNLYACGDCEETWDVMCDQAASTVCELVGYGSPFSEAALTSIETFCNIFGTDAIFCAAFVAHCLGQYTNYVNSDRSVSTIVVQHGIVSPVRRHFVPE